MELWYPGAQRFDGPTHKTGYPDGVAGVPAKSWMRAHKRGEVKHDSTGGLTATLGVLRDHPINSWHFTVYESGIYQHYPVDINCWHGNDTDPDGDVRANIDLVGIEHTRPEGAVEPPRELWETQRRLTTELTRWLATNFGYEPAQALRFPGRFDRWLLCEHNEVGNTPTACPSGRIPWSKIMADLQHTSRMWAYGDEQNGLELRPHQQVTWIDGVEVLSVGDPEGQFPGQIAKNFGGNWLWLRKWDTPLQNPAEFDAYWSLEKGD